jgi:DNA-binding NtrC family response regulator
MFAKYNDEAAVAEGGSVGATTMEISCDTLRGPWVVELGGAGSGQRTVLHPGESVVLGSGRSADIRVDDPCVSSRHCLLEAIEGRLRVVDLDSKNGVYVGSARVKTGWFSSRSGGFVIGHTAVIMRSHSASSGSARAAPLPGLVGSSDAILRVAEQIRRFAPLRAPVLLMGESGVGKDVAARALHSLGSRKGAYVPLNIGTIPDSLADSELFGHTRGAFTGATAARGGAFQAAHDGTLFLDEIGEVSPSVQVRLLRVLEDGVIRPLGGNQSRTVDVRVVSATWAPLLEHCAQKRFRFDLYQRLSTVVIELPPLRERRSDIPALAQHWLERFESEIGVRTMTSAAVSRLVAHDWPGNIRELGSVLYRASVAADGPTVDLFHVQMAIGRLSRTGSGEDKEPERILERAQGNVSLAARLAGVPRSTFRAWLARSRSGDSPRQREPSVLVSP